MILNNPTKRYCFPDGDKASKIAFIGEAPGADEERHGKGFIGPSGELLWRLAANAGLTRADCYVTNVVKERPANNDISIFIKFDRGQVFESQLYKEYEAYLYEELKEVKANVLVPVGAVAMWALARKQLIMKRRGSILQGVAGVDGRKVIPIIHTAAALRQYLLVHAIAGDMKRIVAESQFPEIRLPLRNIYIKPSFMDSMAFLQRCEESPEVAFDIEVMRNEVSCISFAYSTSEVMSIPLQTHGDNYFSPEQEMQLWRKIASILSNPDITKIGQNLVFDSTFLFQRFNIITRNMEDTMIAHKLMYPDLPMGLDYITSVYTKEPYYKDDGKKWFKFGGSQEDFWLYNAKDSAVCIEALPRIKSELEAANNLDVYEHPYAQKALIGPLTYMQIRGIKMNTKAMKEESLRTETEVAELTNKLKELTGYDINPASSKQVQAYFYDIKGEKPYINRHTHRPSADKDAIKRLSRKGYEEARLLQKISTLSYNKSHYLDVNLDTDGRLRCSFNPVGTKYGRLSSSETIFDTGCLPPDAEVLLDFGWIPISEVVEGDHVAQWNPESKELSFAPAIPFQTYFKGDLVVGASEQFQIALTPDHRVISRKPGRDTWRVYSALETSKMSGSEIPVSGRLVGGSITFTAPRLLVASLADGSYENSKVRMSFKKSRKVERLLYLFSKYGIEYTEQECSREGYRRFAFTRPIDWPQKKWDRWTIMLDPDTAEEMIDETQYWDSTKRGSSFIFYTADKEQAKWIATLAHITNRSASIREAEQSEGSWSDTLMYAVNIKPRQHIFLEPQHWKGVPYDGNVYCITVPTSYFLVRYKGVISVTGNTNMQNLPEEFRKYLLADEDCMMFNVDLSQAENRLVAYIAPEPNMIQAFESKIDVHSLTATFFADGLTIEQIKREDDLDIKCPLGSGQYTWRFWGKKANHGLNYDLGYRSFGMLYELPDKDSKFIVERYHTAYPGVRQYHSWVKNILGKTRTLENAFGRKCLFLDRWGDDLFKEAYAFFPQSTVADIINRRGLNYMYYNQQLFRPVDLLLQVHDSIVFQMNYKKHSWEEQALCLIRLKQSLEAPLSWRGRDFVIPADTSVGCTLHKKEMEKIKHDDFTSVSRLAGRLSEINGKIRAALYV